MTDELPRQKGGNGSGPDESPMELLLRDAMNARAARITAHDLRPASPPNTRTRRIRPAYVAAVPIFALAASLALGVLTFRADDVSAEKQTPNPAASLTASPSPSPQPASPSPTAEPTGSATPSQGVPETPLSAPTGGTPSSTAPSAAVPYEFRGVKFKVPAGWRAAPAGSGSTSLCVLSPGAPQSAGAEDCAPYGALLTVYNTADEVNVGAWPSMRHLDEQSGWSPQPYCPVWGNPHAVTGADSLKTGTAVRTKDIVAGRTADKTQWPVTCNSKESFSAQLWGLRNDQVLVSAVGLKPEYQAGLVSILDTLDLGNRQAPQLKANQSDIAITVEGLGVGQNVPNNGTAVTFSVTFRNNSQVSYAKLQPLVFTEPYGGTPDGMVAMNDGKLERQDGTAWTPVPIAPGGGMDYATTGMSAAFPLAPGQSRTVKYRMSLATTDGAGVMPVAVQATLPYTGSEVFTVVGERRIPVRVVTK